MADVSAAKLKGDFGRVFGMMDVSSIRFAAEIGSRVATN